MLAVFSPPGPQGELWWKSRHLSQLSPAVLCWQTHRPWTWKQKTSLGFFKSHWLRFWICHHSSINILLKYEEIKHKWSWMKMWTFSHASVIKANINMKCFQISGLGLTDFLHTLYMWQLKISPACSWASNERIRLTDWWDQLTRDRRVGELRKPNQGNWELLLGRMGN